MSVVKIRVNKSDFKGNARLLTDQLKSGVAQALTERGDVLLATLKVATTGPGRQTRTKNGSNNPGKGIDVPFTSLDFNAIGDITGELNNRLQVASQKKRDKFVVQVGFGREIKSRGGAKAAALYWPNPQAVADTELSGSPSDSSINVQYTEEKRKYPKEADLQNYQPNKTPEQYIPEVILGSSKIVGRNVLRLALYDDIKNRDTLDRVKEVLTDVVQNFNAGGSVPF